MFISLDLETTGFDPNKDSIIEFGAVRFDLNGHRENYQTLINPGFKIPQIINYITNINDEDLSDAPSFEEKKEEIQNFIGNDPIIGHNIQFDTNFLRGKGIELQNPEYDTFHLASTLLPSMPSYSLEVLSHLLDLSHEEKHRALDDSIAAMELFLKLAEEFQSLPEELIETIKEKLKKSDWVLKDFLLKLNHKGKKAEKTHKENKTRHKKEEYKDILETQQNTLFEKNPPYEQLVQNLALHSGNKNYIAVPDETFLDISGKIPADIAQIDLAQNYLSPQRLIEFGNKEHFQDHEIMGLIKVLIWQKNTDSGLLKEMNFNGKEVSILSKINADPAFSENNKETFVQKALQKDKKNAAICSHQFLIRNAERMEELTIIDFDKFTKTLYNESSSYLSLKSLLSCLEDLENLKPENPSIKNLTKKVTILFGLLGIIFEKFNNKDSFNPKSSIGAPLLNQKEWIEIRDIVNGTIETSKELGKINDNTTAPGLSKWKDLLKIMDHCLRAPDLETHMIWLERDWNQEVVVRKIPRSVKSALNTVLGKCDLYKLVGESFDLNDKGNFIKNLYGLPEDLQIKPLKNQNEELSIDIAKNCPDNDEQNKHGLLKYLAGEIEELKGHSAILFNSKKQLQFFTLELNKILKKKKIKVVSQLTGSHSKVAEKFRQDPENSIVLLTTNAWHKFGYPELIDNLYIQKIPFDAPNNPYLISLSQQFDNAFIQLQIPRAILSLKKALQHLGKGRVKILDSRLITKDYGKAFLDNLSTISNPEIFSIDFF